MSLLDRVQRKAEEGNAAPPAPSPQAPAQPLPPAPGQTPGPGQAPAVSEPASERPAWLARSLVTNPPAPASPARQPAVPTYGRSAPAPPVPPHLLGRGAEPGGPPDGPRAASLLNRTAGSRVHPRQQGGAYSQLRSRVHQRLVEELAGNTDSAPPDVVEQKIAELVSEVIVEQSLTLSRQDRQRVIEILIHDVLGLGPLEELLANPELTEIMVNGPEQVYVEERGKLVRSPVVFESTEQLMQVIDRIVSTVGRRVDESSPMVDARLKDGSRVNVIIPPLSLVGPVVTIRKFAKEALTSDDLLRFGSVTAGMVTFLRSCVRARLNMVVSGGTGSGKTTTLNILSSFIPEDERIVTIEDAAELQLRQEHVVTLETRPANVEGRGRVTIRELVINALRMRPDRIVVGECRGGEALDMLQAMNTGHDGSLTTLHANNPRDCISRLETMVLMAGAELPSRAIREQIGSAINVIVHQSRLRDGTRKVVSITEVLGAEGGEVCQQEIFTFRQRGIDPDTGQVIGEMTPTGIIPRAMETLRAQGELVAEELFQPTTEG
ncbi:MAG TPA: ATPase, T2SS/T4P/T4SS family [Candidatus Binatia bacterium]|nr:ATPase, T2SS/T4P/T4SS family [Candidatus Binatia bacterium]